MTDVKWRPCAEEISRVQLHGFSPLRPHERIDDPPRRRAIYARFGNGVYQIGRRPNHSEMVAVVSHYHITIYIPSNQRFKYIIINHGGIKSINHMKITILSNHMKKVVT